jgi:hypothetical protein
MIPEEIMLRKQKNDSFQYMNGYFLTINQLQELVRDFQADCHDGFVSNDKSYIEEWMKNHEPEQKDMIFPE